MTRYLLRYLTTLLLVLTPIFSSAEQLYQVELIIFSHPLSKGISQERWPQDSVMLPNFDNTVSLMANSESSDQNMDLEKQLDASVPHQIPPSQWQLVSEEQHLRRHPDYHILYHQAWQQTLPPSSNPIRIHLYGGEGFKSGGKAVVFHRSDDNNSDESNYADADIWQVDGTLSLYLNRYINSSFDLRFAMPSKQFNGLNHNNNPAEESSQAFTYIALKQSRRTRSNELNYIDHPVYGILMKVTPVETKTV